MKQLKWYTEKQYIEKETGEILKEQEVKQNYRIIKIKTKNEIRNNYDSKRNRYEFGVRTITYICTREGHQTRIWND